MLVGFRAVISRRSDPQLAQKARFGMTLPWFHGATIDKRPKLVLGVESHRHAALAVRDGDRELSTVAGVAAALLNHRARQARVSTIVPRQNLHGAHLRSNEGI